MKSLSRIGIWSDGENYCVLEIMANSETLVAYKSVYIWPRLPHNNAAIYNVFELFTVVSEAVAEHVMLLMDSDNNDRVVIKLC